MIGIIGAMDCEVDVILNKLEVLDQCEIANAKFYQGKILDKDVVLVKCSVAKVNAAIITTILIMKYQVELVISTGIAGGVSPLNFEDVILVDKCYYGDVDVTPFGYQFGQVPGENLYFETCYKDVVKYFDEMNIDYKIAPCLTQDKFITSKEDVTMDIRPICLEMESSAIAHTCSRFNVKVLVLRFISDIIGLPSQIENYAKFETAMGEKSAKITLELVKKL